MEKKSKSKNDKDDKPKKVKLSDFEKMQTGSRALLAEVIKVQLSKSPEYAQKFVERWTAWGEMNQYISDFKKKLGVRPYIKIEMFF